MPSWRLGSIHDTTQARKSSDSWLVNVIKRQDGTTAGILSLSFARNQQTTAAPRTQHATTKYAPQKAGLFICIINRPFMMQEKLICHPGHGCRTKPLDVCFSIYFSDSTPARLVGFTWMIFASCRSLQYCSRLSGQSVKPPRAQKLLFPFILFFRIFFNLKIYVSRDFNTIYQVQITFSRFSMAAYASRPLKPS